MLHIYLKVKITAGSTANGVIQVRYYTFPFESYPRTTNYFGKFSFNSYVEVDFFKDLWNLLRQQRTDSLNCFFEHSELSN